MRSVQVVATTAGVGRLDASVVSVLDSPFPHAGAVIEATGSLDTLRTCAVRDQVPLSDCSLVMPLGRPRAVWGVGLNYHSKAELTRRPAPTEPILYLSAASASGADEPVSVPSDQTVELDYEGEIALVIGRRLYRAAPEDVWPAVAALTAANDLSARDVMRATGSPTLAKSFPGCNPLGMSVSTVDEVVDRDRIRLRTWVNGALHQDDTSAGMIFSVPDLVARLSHYAALEPGDVVLTGTPAGTGQDRNCFLVPGDHVRVEVESVLPLETSFVARMDDGRHPVRNGALHA
ncbi:MAG TPA: fumarylacetoacetate hydrolase family protein [Jatrophihabitans sp.]|jgi:2-keto-4-pentenoate hydratase/2-oxohepta-3-ene-1,7-dioic acid hydratase in catechol pathway